MVDSHVHVVSPDREAYPLSPVELPNGAWYDDHPLAVEDLVALMDQAGVSGAVLVQANGAYGVDNHYAADAAALDPRRFVGVCIVDLTASDRLDAVRYWATDRGMRGIRLFDIPPSDPSWLDAHDTRQVLDLAGELDLRLSVCVIAEQVPRLGHLLDSAGGRPVVVEHCGFADFRGGPPYAAAGPLLDLAARDDVVLKVTPTVFDLGLDPGDDPSELVGHLVSVFGSDRLMWGSDYPQHHERSYADQTARGREVAGLLPLEDQEAFLGGTARRFWFA